VSCKLRRITWPVATSWVCRGGTLITQIPIRLNRWATQLWANLQSSLNVGPSSLQITDLRLCVGKNSDLRFFVQDRLCLLHQLIDGSH